MQDFPAFISSAFEQALPQNKTLHWVGGQNLTAFSSLLTSSNFLSFHKAPQVILVPNLSTAYDLRESLSFFNPACRTHILKGFDVSPYSGLYPNPRLIAERNFWLHRAQYSTGGEFFIAPISALLQKTLPPETLDQNTFLFQKNDDLSSEWIQKLLPLGYQNVPRVEDVGQFCIKGGIFDIFSPAHEFPIRVELFGDSIESLRFFHPESQRTLELTDRLIVLPARDCLYNSQAKENLIRFLNQPSTRNSLPRSQKDFFYENITLSRFFHGIDFLLPHFYSKTHSPLDFFTHPIFLYYYDPIEIQRCAQNHFEELRADWELATEAFVPPPEDLFFEPEALQYPASSQVIHVSNLHIQDPSSEDNSWTFETPSRTPPASRLSGKERFASLSQLIQDKLRQDFFVVVATRTSSQAERVKIILEGQDIPCKIAPSFSFRSLAPGAVTAIPQALPQSVELLGEKVLFLREEDFFGEKKQKIHHKKGNVTLTKNLLLTDLRVGQRVAHQDFGVGIYEGLKTMNIQGVESEFVLLKYRDDDRLYVPVYRINLIRKFSGASPLDKLGHNHWANLKLKVRNHLKDITSELLALYAKRSQIERKSFAPPDLDYAEFSAQFPYDETRDQELAIEAILGDLQKTTPMDRLICGDVGFGKTEVAMRAAFRVVQEGKQVLILVPTTVLCFQHAESFKKRFSGWPIKVESLNRFTPTKQAKEILTRTKAGQVDILIGTHRLLSKDIAVKNLGLLVVDEEHKFGVSHKEKIKKLRTSVDTLALSATPIPRTLNMSLVGIRDLSLINTAPQDRLPIRTFICKYEEGLIKRAIETEVQRGGQVFFLHNKVQNIHEVTQELQDLLPHVRIRFAHGQMAESELERVMVAFFNHEFDVLVSTTIIESGIDIPSANTILINRADTLGLSQLYQLRGRVGRSKERGYCYLLIPSSGTMDPVAQDRLRVLQENTELGSGLRIAQHDLELRGAGNILGEEQSGHANAIGYDLYMELLDQALRESRGENLAKENLEPEINLKIPALIPEDYIPDIRTRMSYYFELSKIETPFDMDRYEEELADQFGKLPPPVMNLMGVMLLKQCCKDLGIRDLSAGTESISLLFTEHTPLSAECMVDLVTGTPKKYTLTPDQKLVVRVQDISWPQIYKELSALSEFAS